MPVKIRLTRRGRKKLALYDIIVADSRSPRDGKFIEKLGTLNPTTHPASIKLDSDRALYWVMTGAQPTDTVKTILSANGILLRKHLQIGVNKGAVTQEQADKRFEDWKNEREKTSSDKALALADKKELSKSERLAAEAKVNTARQDAINAKNNAALAAAEAANKPAEPAAEEAPASTPATETEA